MKMNLNPIVVLLLLVMNTHAQIDNNSTNEKSHILSRRKRFLIFPEGSSLQLVFCTTYQMLIAIGDIFLWGNTAALAWQLPQDPYSPFDHHADPLHRRIDTKVIYYTDESGKVIDKKPFYRKPIVNPAFAKRSVDLLNKKRNLGKFKINRKQMHASENKRAYLNNIEKRSVEFHRSSRASFYQKMETMLHGLGVNGNDCVMKTLCLVGKSKEQPQGMFFQEIMKALFTLPSSLTMDQFSKYDAAYTATGSCDDLYPDCNESVLNPDSPIITY